VTGSYESATPQTYVYEYGTYNNYHNLNMQCPNMDALIKF